MSKLLPQIGIRTLSIVTAGAGLLVALAVWDTVMQPREHAAVQISAAPPAHAQSTQPDPVALAKSLGAFPLTPNKTLTGCTTSGGTTTCTYTIQLQNNYDDFGTYDGPVSLSDSVYPVTALTATSSAPGWTCTSGAAVQCTNSKVSIPVNGSISMTLAISFPASTTPAPDFNCVKILVPAAEGSDCADVVNTGAPYDLDIDKQLVGMNGIADATVGKPVHFEVKVQNKGGVPANSAMVVVDEVPEGFTVTNVVSPPFWSCSPTSGAGPMTITCTHQTTGTAIPPPTSVNPPTYFPTIEVHGHTTKVGLFTNCATPYVIGGRDTTPDAYRHCADVIALPGDSSFNKQALDESGNPITGPVSVGDTITYVLSYAASTQGPLTITDTLSPNQRYVSGSLQAPTAWTWSPAQPYSVNNSTTYTAAANTSSQSFTMDVPVSSGGSATSNTGSGDGFAPIPVGSKIYGINHHAGSTAASGNINCWNASDLSPCWTSARSLGTVGNVRLTPNQPHTAVVNSIIYYPSTRYSNATGSMTIFGMGCWDTTTDTPCAFVDLPGTPSVPGNALTSGGNSDFYGVNRYVAGVQAVPGSTGRVLVFAVDRLYCMDVSGSSPVACPGWTPAILPGASVSNTDLIVESSATPTMAFVLYHPNAESTPFIACYSLSSGALCSGWTSVGAGSISGARGWALSPYLDTSGNTLAVCAHFWSGGIKCVKATDGTEFTPAAAFTTLVQGDRMWEAFRIPGTNKILYSHDNDGQSDCYDFGTGAACSGYAPGWSQANTLDYGYAADPQNAACLFGLGHANVVWRFASDTGSTAGACQQPTSPEKTFSLEDLFCGVKPKSATWTKITVEGAPSQLNGGTIRIYDKNGAEITSVSPITVAANDVDYDLNIPATGNNSEIKVKFEPTYSGATSTPYKLRIHYSSDADPQICYKAEVLKCGEEVTNTAVFKADRDETTKTVNLGRAIGPECEDCLKLESKVSLLSNGRTVVSLTQTGPANFMTSTLEVRPLTPGVSVFPPMQPSSGTTNWTILGANPGDTVKLQVDGVKQGAGSVGNGEVDQCCSSEIEIKIPEEPNEEHHDYDVKIDKTGERDPRNAGRFTYELTVTNVADPIPNASAIVVTDTLPAGMTITSATGTNWNCVISGQTLTCTYTAVATLATGASLPPITIKAVTPIALEPHNCASVNFTAAAGVIDRDMANNKDCVDLPLTQRDDRYDVKIDKTGWQQVGPHYWYEHKVTNLGSKITQTGALTVSDTLPTGMMLVSITAPGWTCTTSGQTITCTYTGAIPIATGATLPTIRLFVGYGGQTIPENCSVVALVPSSGLTDADPSNNRDCVTIRGTQTRPIVDLRVDKSAKSVIGPIPYMSEFGLTVKNTGTGAITAPAAITVTDVVPAGMTFMSAGGTNWNCGTGYPKSAGSTITCTYTGALPVAAGASLPLIKIIAAAPGSQGRPIRNCATVNLTSRTQSDANTGNNKDCVETVETQERRDVDLTVKKTAKSVAGPVPNTFEFRLSARNIGTAAITAPATITVTDIVPPGMTFMSAGGTNWNCGTGYPKPAGATIVCTYKGPLPVAPSATLPPVKIMAAALGAQGGSIRNCAKVKLASRSQNDSNVGNNDDCVSVDTRRKDDDGGNVDFSLNKSAKPTIGPVPNTFEFSLTARNAGDAALNSPVSIQVSDVVPSGMVFLNAGGSNWSCGSGYPKTSGATVTCAYTGPMPVGAGATLPPVKITAAVTGATQPTIRNCAAVTVSSRSQRDARPGNNDDCATIEVNRQTTPTTTEDASCRPPEHWNGRRCVRCRDGETWDEGARRCRALDKPVSPLTCDQRTTNFTPNGCVCRYPNMQQFAPHMCACPAGTSLTPGVGCVPECREPMTLNRDKLVCECPKGTELKGDKCEKEDGLDFRFQITPRIPGRPRPTEPAPAPARPDGRP